MSFKRSRSSVGSPFVRRQRISNNATKADAARIAKRIAISTSTQKSYQVNGAFTTTNAGSVIALSDVAYGAADYQRIDNGLLPLSLHVRWTSRVNSLLTNASFRVVIFRSRSYLTTPPGAQIVLDLDPNDVTIVGGTEHTAARRLDRALTVQVLHDSIESVNNDTVTAGQGVGRAHDVTLKLGSHKLLFADGETIASSNKLYMMVISNSASDCAIEMTSNLMFIDK